MVTVGKIVTRLAETELLANQEFLPETGSKGIEGWTAAPGVRFQPRPSGNGTEVMSSSEAFTVSQTVDPPFAGARGNWRIVSTLRCNAASARIVYAIEGRTHGEWSLLDKRETGGNAQSIRLVLEPRPLSHITPPPDQLRVTIAVAAPPNTAIALETASLRTAHAGFFNSLNPPTWIELLAIAALISLANAAFAWVLIKHWRSPSLFRAAFTNTALLLNSLSYTLIALEIVTRTLLVFPDSMATTRVSELWWARHWKPVNEFGYRDVSHSTEALAGKKVLFVVGDSFAAGHGVQRFEDVFHQQIARQLGAGWEVVVIAKPGLSTRDELTALAAYPAHPDAIVLAHVWNDVNSAFLAHGVEIPGKPRMARALRPIVLRSYFLDFVYWRVRGLRTPMRLYLDLILSAYEDGELWETHKNDLSKFADYAKQSGAPLLVVAFPALEDIEGSRATSSRVAEHFRSLGIPSIDCGDVFAGENSKDITINRFDSHPNEAAHKKVADEIYTKLEAMRRESAQK